MQALDLKIMPQVPQCAFWCLKQLSWKQSAPALSYQNDWSRQSQKHHKQSVPDAPMKTPATYLLLPEMSDNRPAAIPLAPSTQDLIPVYMLSTHDVPVMLQKAQIPTVQLHPYHAEHAFLY